MLKNLLAAAAFTGFIATAPLAQAQPMEPGFHHGEMGVGLEFLHGLSLTDAQKTQIHDILKTSFTAHKGAMEQMHALHEQIIGSLLAGSSIAQIRPLVKQEEALRSQGDESRLELAIQLRAVLTPEQLTQAAATHTKLQSLDEQEREVMHGAGAPQE